MHIRTFRLTFTLSFLFLLLGCNQLDPSQDFEMALNDKKYAATFSPAKARIQEFEAGFNDIPTYTLFFPLQDVMNKPTAFYGLEITLDPARITPGQEISFGLGQETSISVAFYPSKGHRPNEGIMLSFASSGGEDAGGVIRFDAMTPGENGRVSGSLQNAVLYGYYDTFEEIGEVPEEPLRLEVWNFPFDTIWQWQLTPFE